HGTVADDILDIAAPLHRCLVILQRDRRDVSVTMTLRALGLENARDFLGIGDLGRQSISPSECSENKYEAVHTYPSQTQEPRDRYCLIVIYRDAEKGGRDSLFRRHGQRRFAR